MEGVFGMAERNKEQSAEDQAENQLEEQKKEAFRVGVGVFVLLAAFTIGEYWIGSVAASWWAPLLAIAAMKAFLIMRDYMHVGRLFAGEEEGHE
jgi:fatty acid desaturase